MQLEFKLPELGENIESGDVVNVLVEEGQVIEGNQGVCELETDKAVVEIPCPHPGRVVKLHINKGDTVRVGQTLLTIETADESAASPGDTASGGQAALAAVEPAEAAPRPTESGVTVRPSVEAAQPPDSTLIPAGPAARRLARQLGVDLRQVRGTGRGGRITPEDVQRAAAAGGAATVSLDAAAASGAAAPPAGKAESPAVGIEPVIPPGEEGEDAWGPVRRERIARIRQTIAAQMSRSASTIPHVTNFDDADVTELESLRKSVPPGLLGAGLKLTMMPLVMKAVAIALRRHPLLNASLDEENQQIIYKQYVNLGVAVDTPRGLVVPVVRSADRMSIAELAQAVADVARRARNAEFAIEELRGGTFTISNLGAVGGAYSTPIINHPEVAILLLGRSRWLLVVRNGKIEPRLMMPLSLSYDHRLVDGAAAARFLNDVIALLQSPGVLLFAR